MLSAYSIMVVLPQAIIFCLLARQSLPPPYTRLLLQVMSLIDNELSEPYSIFTYRYFLRQWPYLCYLAVDPTNDHCFGCVVAKMDVHRDRTLRGYIGMLTVEKEYRHLGVGK